MHDVHERCTELEHTQRYLSALDGLRGLDPPITAHAMDCNARRGRWLRVLNPSVRTYVRVRIPSRAPHHRSRGPNCWAWSIHVKQLCAHVCTEVIHKRKSDAAERVCMAVRKRLSMRSRWIEPKSCVSFCGDDMCAPITDAGPLGNFGTWLLLAALSGEPAEDVDCRRGPSHVELTKGA